MAGSACDARRVRICWISAVPSRLGMFHVGHGQVRERLLDRVERLATVGRHRYVPVRQQELLDVASHVRVVDYHHDVLALDARRLTPRRGGLPRRACQAGAQRIVKERR